MYYFKNNLEDEISIKNIIIKQLESKLQDVEKDNKNNIITIKS